MDMEQDANILGNLSAGDTNAKDQEPIQNPNPVDGALNKDNVDAIDQFVVDFSAVEAAQEALGESQGSIDTIRRDGQIGEIRQAALENHLGPLRDKLTGVRIRTTSELSGVNVGRALEAATGNLEVKRIEVNALIGQMATRMGPILQSLERRKVAFDARTTEFVQTQMTLVELFNSTFITQALMQVDQDAVLQMRSTLLYATVNLDEGYAQSKPLYDLLSKLRLNTSYLAACRGLTNTGGYLEMAGKWYNIDDLTPISGPILAENESFMLCDLVDQIGTEAHSSRAKLTHAIGLKATGMLRDAAGAAEEANKAGDVSVVTNERLFNQARLATQLMSEACTQLAALESLYAIAGLLTEYALVRQKECGLKPAVENDTFSRTKKTMSFLKAQTNA